MLPKNRRIPRKEFTHIIKNGKRYHSLNFVLFISINNDNKNENSKFSFSVSKKMCKKAVDRNRLRRVGYSVISNNLKKIKSGYHCFFSFKKIQKPTNFTILEKEVMELLYTSGVLI